jgi:hypothetical protein
MSISIDEDKLQNDSQYIDLVIERILRYGALVVIASQYGEPDEAKRLTVMEEAEEVLDEIKEIISGEHANSKS